MLSPENEINYRNIKVGSGTLSSTKHVNRFTDKRLSLGDNNENKKTIFSNAHSNTKIKKSIRPRTIINNSLNSM